MAWLRDKGVAWDEIPLLDDRLISRIIDPPRDEHGRLRIRPKGERAPSAHAAFKAKWTAQGLWPWQIEQLWRQGLRV